MFTLSSELGTRSPTGPVLPGSGLQRPCRDTTASSRPADMPRICGAIDWMFNRWHRPPWWRRDRRLRLHVRAVIPVCKQPCCGRSKFLRFSSRQHLQHPAKHLSCLNQTRHHRPRRLKRQDPFSCNLVLGSNPRQLRRPDPSSSRCPSIHFIQGRHRRRSTQQAGWCSPWDLLRRHRPQLLQLQPRRRCLREPRKRSRL